MKKILALFFAITLIFVFVGCSNNQTNIPPITTQITQAQQETTILRWEDVSLTFPMEIEVSLEEFALDELGFERQFRAGFYSMAVVFMDLAPRDEVDDWVRYRMPLASSEQEPRLFSLIKYFDISFGDFDRVARTEYLFRREMNFNLYHEGMEIPNPYLLFTFNLERINDYYSLDQARHTSARLWLEEWLETNEPYASYSAFRAANP